jgi:hypothetical protein
MRKLNPVIKLKLQGLLGILIAMPFAWELFKHGSMGALPAKWRAIALAVTGLLAFAFFLHSRTKDKTEVKPKWW